MTAQSGGKRDYDHVLVGGGIASVSAAHALRREDPSARIAILCGERVLPYQRQPLTKEFLAGNLAPAAITIHPAGFYEMRRIDLLLGAGVASVDCGAHVVKLEDCSAIQYGKLLIATGASPRSLAVPGATLAGIGHLHDVDDALVLRDNAARQRRLLIVGGGFTGCEAAATMRERDLEVTLVRRVALTFEPE